ncbi:hypothetical protein QBC37DRAFT_411756 [Rhypophila decipiens]|uniref:Uncharacterized protein n=1 Tax=Rhypophila decipiens TaxID=261697 RepID=A0AAN6YLI1_9PEZI|nr:hypothetical protein QBC37DRAFT_411756 [Rhypophila decipiens]
MPPRPAIAGVQAALRAATPSTWRATASPATSLISRYSTSTATQETSSSSGPVPVPPESPNYIKLHEPPQSSEPRLPPIRGHVPVPRQVFTSRDGNRPRRVSPAYVSTIKPKTARQVAGKRPRNDHEARRWELAETRRKALTEGLQGLWDRKRTHDKEERRRSFTRARNNQAAASRPERPDEVLTSSSIGAHVLVTEVPLDPNRFEDAEKAKLAHDAKQAVKADARRDALCQMYMAAGKFIVDEDELEARIHSVFGENQREAAESIWNLHGEPPTLAAEAANVHYNVADIRRKDSNRTVLRQKAVAEALTGGKL